MLGWLVCAGLGVFLSGVCVCVWGCAGVYLCLRVILYVCVFAGLQCVHHILFHMVYRPCLQTCFCTFSVFPPSYNHPSILHIVSLSPSYHRGLQRAVTPQKRRTWKIRKVHYQLLLYFACLFCSLGSTEQGVCVWVHSKCKYFLNVAIESKAMFTPDI